MPIYEYECQSCGKRTEVLQRMDEAPLAACPQCGGEVKKLFSAPAVQFKGSGWYVTDYAGKKGGGGGSGGTETKSESKSEKKEAPAESKSSGSSSASGGSGSTGGTD
ncbi:MAG TPA: FmdB family zinc ribbon protein [Thermoanaerobaculia bacterium]